MRNKITFLFVLVSFWAQAQIVLTNQIKVMPGSFITAQQNVKLAANAQVTNDGTITTETLLNDPGASLTGAGEYILNNAWLYDGTFTPSTSKLIFKGATPILKPAGNTFYDVELQMPVGGKLQLLNQNLPIDHQLIFANVDNYLEIGTQDLVLAASANVINADNQRYVITNNTGIVQKIDVNTFLFPIGFDATTYNPISVTTNGALTTVGFRVLQNTYVGGLNGATNTEKGIDASWAVVMDPGGTFSVTPKWSATDEHADFDRNNCDVHYYTNTWANSGSFGPAFGSDPYQITRAGLTPNIHVLTIASPAAPLPVELLSFDAKKANRRDVHLTWQTATEKNTKAFHLMRSADAQQWEEIGTVSAAGNSVNTLDYAYDDLDANPSRLPVLYYRLKIVDYDGQFALSEIRSVSFDKNGGGLSVYPNPSIGDISIVLSENTTQDLDWKLLDILGRQVTVGRIPAGQQADTAIPIHLGDQLPAGQYFFQMNHGVDLYYYKLQILEH